LEKVENIFGHLQNEESINMRHSRLTKEFISKTTPPHPCPLPPGERGLIISPPLRGGDEGGGGGFTNDRVSNSSHRYKGLVEYISGRYGNAVEIGIGHFPDVALALLKRGVRVFATDVKAFQYGGLKIIIDDIIEPDFTLYAGLDLIYSLRPPSELVPFMMRLAERLSTDLIIKPLLSEHLDGQLVCHGDTPFFLWSYR
jgi:hypothetical protein